jgi:hypothetical protein
MGDTPGQDYRRENGVVAEAMIQSFEVSRLQSFNVVTMYDFAMPRA